MSQQPIQHAIHRLFAHHDLTAADADAAMTQIMEGEATP
ncbi:MAG: anthranilate phosphoribosyltransferase, partial [Caldilineaceae bacterium]|nr:anthranilate phosphoribosyltransferase [Caldilineaceae bacterium]